MLLALGSCATGPPEIERMESFAFHELHATRLGVAATQAASRQSNRSGVDLLDTGNSAFLARAALIETAERAIDAQYYIWNSDLTGSYLAARLYAAAERGVRVRLLLDDINIGARDAALAAMDAHPNIEVRIYNPFTARSGPGRVYGFTTEFARLNRRMHNKSFTVDGSVTIVGGRNIGDEYFDADTELNFRDRELLAIGPVVEQVAQGFDAFWNSYWAYPVRTLTSERLTADEGARLLARANGHAERLVQLGHRPATRSDEGLAYMLAAFTRLIWAPARLIYDDPPAPDALRDDSMRQSVAQALAAVALTARSEILIESAYFILDDATLQTVAELRQRGTRIAALTNSLASNDVVANHSGYARRRKDMLASGIDIYELRADADSCRQVIATAPQCASALFGLHSKTIIFDRRTVYVGSFNVNLRSTFLNTETALIVESETLAARIADSIERDMQPRNSWQVTLDERNRLLWQTERDGARLTSRHEPDTGFWRRFKAAFIALWPIEKYL